MVEEQSQSVKFDNTLCIILLIKVKALYMIHSESYVHVRKLGALLS